MTAGDDDEMDDVSSIPGDDDEMRCVMSLTHTLIHTPSHERECVMMDDVRMWMSTHHTPSPSHLIHNSKLKYRNNC